MPLFLRIALLFSLCFMVACLPSRSSRGDDDDDDSAADDDDAASDDDDAASDDDDATDDDDAASSGEAECLELNDQECAICMQELYPSGFEAYIDYVLQYVYCGNQCSFACADFCVNPDPKGDINEACGQCAGEVTLESPDGQDFLAACSQDVGCENYFLGSQACYQ